MEDPMPVRLVTDPADVPMDPDAYPWDVRLKYATVAELLADYQASNALLGRQNCPVSDYFKAHLDDGVLEVEAFVYAHPEWGPWVLCESLHRTLLFNHAAAHPNGDAVAAWAQHYLALNLVRHHPYERARGALETTLKHPQMRFVSPAAAEVILAYLAAGHPNPRRFLEKPEVAAKFPDLDLARFAAPDFD
jgi:hypothetical protein